MYLVASDYDKSGQENSKSATETHPISHKSQRLLCQVPAYRQIVFIREISCVKGRTSVITHKVVRGHALSWQEPDLMKWFVLEDLLSYLPAVKDSSCQMA